MHPAAALGQMVEQVSLVETVSPMSSIRSKISYDEKPYPEEKSPPTSYDEKFPLSPVEKGTYFSDEKVMIARTPTRSPTYRLTPEVEAPVVQNQNQDQNQTPPYYATPLPDRPQQRPFWKRYLLWIVAIVLLLAIFIGVVVGITAHHHKSTKDSTSTTVSNNTLHSVASSGLFLNDKKTWNMQTFVQNTTGGIILQYSLDGKTFQNASNVVLDIKARVGSPMSATAEVDLTNGVVTVCFPSFPFLY